MASQAFPYVLPSHPHTGAYTIGHTAFGLINEESMQPLAPPLPGGWPKGVAVDMLNNDKSARTKKMNFVFMTCLFWFTSKRYKVTKGCLFMHIFYQTVTPDIRYMLQNI
jgi:hypothetical protein